MGQEHTPRKPPTISASVVERVIALSAFRASELAALIFENNAHPYHALQRVRRGETSLTVDQLARLNEVTGQTYAELMHEGRILKAPEGYRVEVDGVFSAVVTDTGVVTVTEHRKGAVRVIKTFVPISGELTPTELINKVKVAVL